MSNSKSVLSYVSSEDILDDSNELTLFISRIGTIILINNRGSEVLNRPKEEIIGMNWFNDFIPDSHSDKVLVEFSNNLSLPEKPVFQQEYPVLSTLNTEHSVSMQNRIITDEDDIVMCILVSGHVTDDSEKRSDELIRNEEMYRSVVEHSNDAIIIHINGIIVFANSTAVKLTGYENDVFLGTNVLDYVSSDYKPLVLKNMNDRMSGRDSPSIYEIKVIKKDGGTIYVEINVSIIQYEGEQAFMVLFRDLSERRILEEQLRQSQKMEAIGQLAGGVAHDFNNILQVINGYTELAITSLEEADPLQDMLRQISMAGDRASSLVSQLLTFSRNQLIVTRILDINEVIAEHLSMLERLIGENITLEFDSSEDIELINADRAMLGQILMNICLNSRDAMPDGGKIIVKTEQVSLDSEFCMTNPSAEAGLYVMMSISDNGSGMDEDTLSRIFEPFFSTKGISEGTGLGLSTVYGIVIQHDGLITANSKIGVGSTFSVYFPLADKNTKIEDQATDYEILDDASKTIVITEDDESVRNLASEILVEAGHEVITASNGEEAVLLITDSPNSVDLVILDVIMPVLGGYDAADRIRAIRPDMPLIFCSGYSKGPHNNKHRNLERSRFLSKPYSMALLLNAINELFAETM